MRRVEADHTTPAGESKTEARPVDGSGTLSSVSGPGGSLMHSIFAFLRGLVASWLAMAALFAGDEPARRTPVVEFAGYTAVEKSAWVILTDRETKEVSSWMQVGQEWKGYRIAQIDGNGERIGLTKGTESWVIPLKKEKVTEETMGRNRGPNGFTLLRGDVNWTNGRWIYSADAVVQFGPAVLSAVTGVMTVEGDTIRGHLSLDSVDGRSIEAEEATAKLVDGHPMLVAGNLGVKISIK
eukprot:TRINITY_DN98651_c0_g1_i1.p1 TRINITY_DN98651_c0_g1~~TRINITY_DN98651_c0_g1_i1.p1  ORF type:complete len:239 (-),score=20.30 TRINITY_DN98651_c0_g1_i1:130-846(-)